MSDMITCHVCPRKPQMPLDELGSHINTYHPEIYAEYVQALERGDIELDDDLDGDAA